MKHSHKKYLKSLSLSCVMGAGLLWGGAALAQPAMTASPLIAANAQMQTSQITTPMAALGLSVQPAKANVQVGSQISWQSLKHQSARKTVEVRRSLRRGIKKAAATIPGVSAFKWADRNMGMPAIMLIFAMFFVFGLLMMSGPLSRTGGHH